MGDFIGVAPGVLRLPLLPFDGLNVYIVGNVLVDSGAPVTRRGLLRALHGCELGAHALTHAHPDHQGASRAVCQALSIPLWCGGGDRAAAESGTQDTILPRCAPGFSRLCMLMAGAGHPVSRVLSEGDEVADFTVLETPGHTPGHISLWRERDRVLILGDVLFHRDPVTLRPGLRQPHRMVTYDPPLNRASARAVAELEPMTVCFGHGAPLRDPRAFAAFVAGLSEDHGSNTATDLVVVQG